MWQVREGLTISGPRFSYHVEHHKLGSAVHLLALGRRPEKQIWHSGQTPRWATRIPLQTMVPTPLAAGSAGSLQLSFEPLLRNHSQLVKASLLKVMFFLGSACLRDGWMWGIKIQPSPLKLGKFQKGFSFSVPPGVSWGLYQDFVTARFGPLHTCFLSFSQQRETLRLPRWTQIQLPREHDCDIDITKRLLFFACFPGYNGEEWGVLRSDS